MADKDKHEDDEFEIPDSDDVDEEDGDELDPGEDEELIDFDAPHDHPHTPGYPAHAHHAEGVAYQADQTFASGGTELFTPERHDADSDRAAEAEREQRSGLDLGPLADGFETVAQDLGWETDRNVHPASPGGVIFGLSREGRDVSVTIAYTE